MTLLLLLHPGDLSTADWLWLLIVTGLVVAAVVAGGVFLLIWLVKTLQARGDAASPPTRTETERRP